MIWLALLGNALASDPSALRHLHDDAPWAVDVGTNGVSVAADMGPLVGLSFQPGAWVGASVGHSKILIGDERGWRLDGTLAAGAAALLATPGAALTGTAALRYGPRGDNLLLTGGLVVPAAIRLDWPLEALAPTDLELTAGGRLGPIWLGGRAFFGGAFVPGEAPSLRSGAALWLRRAE